MGSTDGAARSTAANAIAIVFVYILCVCVVFVCCEFGYPVCVLV